MADNKGKTRTVSWAKYLGLKHVRMGFADKMARRGYRLSYDRMHRGDASDYERGRLIATEARNLGYDNMKLKHGAKLTPEAHVVINKMFKEGAWI